MKGTQVDQDLSSESIVCFYGIISNSQAKQNKEDIDQKINKDKQKRLMIMMASIASIDF